MTQSDTILLEADILTDNLYKLDVETASKIIDTTFNTFKLPQGNSPQSKKVYDYAQDAFLIYAAFWQAYGIDLNKERDKLHYMGFLALFSGLPDDTRMSQIMGIRGAEIPAPNKNNRREIARLNKLKLRWALKEDPESGTHNLDDALMKMFKQLYSQATKGG